jgi:hypothetical protein
MRVRLQTALLGDADTDFTIERCVLDHATYLLEEDRCHLTYAIGVRHDPSGFLSSTRVSARIFSDPMTCQRYFEDRLVPLVELTSGRVETSPFRSPVAMLASLSMVVSVFPIDGELPTLRDVTDSQRMIEVFGEILPVVLNEDVTVDGCGVELFQYKRRNRCVLRYGVDVRRRGAESSEAMVIYGKVHSLAASKMADGAIEALRAHVSGNEGVYQFNIPRLLDFRKDLQLTLLEAIPGARRIAKQLKKWGHAAPGSKSRLPLENDLDVCARIAAVLHTSGIGLGQTRTFEDELEGLRLAISSARRVSPEFGRQLMGWHEQIRALAQATKPLSLCFNHGDFKSSQVLFDGEVGGLVDFDTVCQAEAARDLGQFLTYLRIVVLKVHGTASGALAEELVGRFVDAYVVSCGEELEDEERLRARVLLYEAWAALRLALKSWQKFKSERLERAITVLGGTLSRGGFLGASAGRGPRRFPAASRGAIPAANPDSMLHKKFDSG